MVAIKTVLVGAVAAAALAPVDVDALGYLTVPKLKFTNSAASPSQFATTIDGRLALLPPPGKTYTGTTANNVRAFNEAFKASDRYKSLRVFIQEKAPSAGACGTTTFDPSNPQMWAADYIEWSEFRPTKGGPCELWCGDVRVLYLDNCQDRFSAPPARLSLKQELSVAHQKTCASSKELRFYWISVHDVKWQIYINCASLKGSQ